MLEIVIPLDWRPGVILTASGEFPQQLLDCAVRIRDDGIRTVDHCLLDGCDALRFPTGLLFSHPVVLFSKPAWSSAGAAVTWFLMAQLRRN